MESLISILECIEGTRELAQVLEPVNEDYLSFDELFNNEPVERELWF